MAATKSVNNTVERK